MPGPEVGVKQILSCFFQKFYVYKEHMYAVVDGKNTEQVAGPNLVTTE